MMANRKAEKGGPVFRVQKKKGLLISNTNKSINECAGSSVGFFCLLIVYDRKMLRHGPISSSQVILIYYKEKRE